MMSSSAKGARTSNNHELTARDRAVASNVVTNTSLEIANRPSHQENPNVRTVMRSARLITKACGVSALIAAFLAPKKYSSSPHPHQWSK